MQRDDEHFPSPAIMSVHFEAKTNLYFVLCVYKMVTIFLGDGKRSLDWLHFAHNFSNCNCSAWSHRSEWMNCQIFDCKTLSIRSLHQVARQNMAFKLSAQPSISTTIDYETQSTVYLTVMRCCKGCIQICRSLTLWYVIYIPQNTEMLVSAMY